MASWVIQEDIIAYIEQEINFTKGNSQSFQIILYRDDIGSQYQLNTQDVTAIYVTIKNNNDDKLLQYSEPVVYGASDTLIVGSVETRGYLDFEVTALQSNYLTTGEIFAEVTVVYDNYYPQAKTYALPPLKLGFAYANPNENETPGSSSTPIPTFNIEYVNGFNPTLPGKVSFNSSTPDEVSTIIFRNLDTNLVRLTLLENFLIKRIQTENAEGIITIMDTDDSTHYSVYKIQDWSRVDITPGDGDSDNTDGIQLDVVFEASSNGPGVSVTSWQVGQNITFSLDSYGSGSNNNSEGVLTYGDKNLISDVTDGNYSQTGVLITYTPYSDSYVTVKVNGLPVSVGDGVKTEDVYFSGDGGDTARLIADIVGGDELIWNGEIAGYDLGSDDKIDINYEIDSSIIISGGSNDINGVLTYTDLNLSPSPAIGNYAATGIYITYTPYVDSYVTVMVNGISVSLGDGVKTEDCYFSGDDGVTAIPITDIRAGDQLIWNAIIAGFNLDTGDEVNFGYEASSNDIV